MAEDIVPDEMEADPDGILGDAVWTTAFINNLPDAAFAAISPGGTKDGEGKTIPRSLRHLPHHNASVKKGTENSSVDKPHLRNALARVNQTDMSASLKASARTHLRNHARALGISTEEIDKLMGPEPEEVTVEQMAEEVTAAVDLATAEGLLLSLVDANAGNDLIELAQTKVAELAGDSREMLVDDFEGRLEVREQAEDGVWHFTAVVAQADRCNKNKRMYPKKEFQNNLTRVNKLCRRGKFTGRDGHPDLFGADKPSEVCVRYDNVFLQGENLVMEGILIPTQAGLDIGTQWKHGLDQEFSIVGYGKAEYKNSEKDGDYAEISDYVLMGCDPVRWGAATTRVLKVTAPKDGLEVGVSDIVAEIADDASATVVADNLSLPAQEQSIMPEETTQTPEAPVAPVAPPAPPVVDVAAITAQAVADATAAAQEAAKGIVEAARAQAALEAAKQAAIAKLAESDENLAMLVSRHFDDCQTVEDIAAKVTAITPQIDALRKPKPVVATGIHVHRDAERARFMFDGSMNVIDRPETIEEVTAALLVGLEDNGRNDPSNKAWTMSKIIENYMQSKENARYLYAMTRSGFAETATTSTALGTTLPMVLPIIRQMLPRLIPYAIGAVVPIDRPTARVYFYDPQYTTGTPAGSDMDDSSVFASDWASHTEGETKSQIDFAMTYQEVTAIEKSVYWDLTSVLIQDMQAIYNMDAEASMLSAATDYLSLEINMAYIGELAANAGITMTTFGSAIPASGFENLNDWLTWGLSQYLNRASALIAKKMYQSAGWIITGPTQATLFEASNAYAKLPAGAVQNFGMGLRQTGSWQNLFDIYVCDWAETLTGLKNKMLIGYSPLDWNRASAVFCPYIPLYLSPIDSNASKNTIARAASSRNAFKVLQANGLAVMTVASSAGTALTYVD